MNTVFKDEIIWLTRSIEAYKNALNIAIKHKNREKENEYKMEIIKATKKLEKII